MHALLILLISTISFEGWAAAPENRSIYPDNLDTTCRSVTMPRTPPRNDPSDPDSFLDSHETFTYRKALAIALELFNDRGEVPEASKDLIKLGIKMFGRGPQSKEALAVFGFTKDRSFELNTVISEFSQALKFVELPFQLTPYGEKFIDSRPEAKASYTVKNIQELDIGIALGILSRNERISLFGH